MSENQQPKKPRPRDDPVLRQLGMFVIILVSLHVTYLITTTHPTLEEIMILGFALPSTAIFGSISGATLFVVFLKFSREVKIFKKKNLEEV